MPAKEPKEPIDHLRAERGMRGPAWRIELAHTPASWGTRRLLKQHGEHIRHANAYIDLCRRGADGRRQASRRYPIIAAAEAVNQNRKLCERLKIMVLGDCPRPEIAKRLGLDEQTVEAWETLYFDVRPAREATGWIFAHVIWPEQDRGNGALAAKYKLAYCGGPGGARAILDAESRVPLSAGERLFDRKLKLQLKFDEAVEAPLGSSREKIRFTKFFAELQLTQQRLRLEERKLEVRCQEALRKHELADMRRQAAAERQQRREDRAQKAQQRAQRKRNREHERRLEEELLLQHQRLAEQQAALARAAVSPLAKLTWSPAKPPQAEAEPATAPATAPATEPAESFDWHCTEETDFVSGSEWPPADETEADALLTRREVAAA